MSSKTIKIIDTHTHLYDSVYSTDRAGVLVSARAVGIIGVISVSETLKNAEFNLNMTRIHSEVLPAAGLYPGNSDLEHARKIQKFISANYRKLVAIGEVGLDFWIAKEDETRELQREIFSQFIKQSQECELPLNVHSRSAGKHAIEMLLKEGAKHVQMHAFDGKASSALPAVEAGFFFSIPPSIVRSKQKQKLVRKLPLSSILLETDSPVLGPSPDERNVPANITVAAESIAEIKGVSVEQVYEEAYNNTLRLYDITGAMQQLYYRKHDKEEWM